MKALLSTTAQRLLLHKLEGGNDSIERGSRGAAVEPPQLKLLRQCHTERAYGSTDHALIQSKFEFYTLSILLSTNAACPKGCTLGYIIM